MHSRGHILIVEDETTVAFLLQDVLREYGYDIQLATDGLMALEIIRSQPPSLILLDLGLPKMNGVELTQQLDAEGYGKIPIVLMTANNVARSLLAHKRTYGHLDKPFHLHELLQRVEQYMKPPEP